MRPLPPIPFSDGPAFINLLPKHTSTLVVTSAQGLVNVVDVSNTNSSEFYHVCVPFTILPPSPPTLLQARHHLLHCICRRFIQRLLLGLWRCRGYNSSPHSSRRIVRALFQRLSRSAGRMGRPPRTAPRNKLVRFHVCRHSLCLFSSANVLRSSPLNSIGMPYYTTPLLSSWIPQFLSSTNPPYPPPAKIPPQILSMMKINDNVAYAALPKELRGWRNRVVVSSTKDQARFRSGKGRRDDDDDDDVSLSNVLRSAGTHPWHRSS